MTLNLSWSTLEELGEPITMLEKEQRKEFAYLMILIVFLGQSIIIIFQLIPVKVWFRVLNLKLTMVFLETHYNTYMSKMYCALAVLFLPDLKIIMVPAKTVCPPSWTREYYGYLMTENDSHHRSSCNCVDVDPEVVPGESSDTDPSLFYHTAMASHVHRMRMVACSHVLCVQSDFRICTCSLHAVLVASIKMSNFIPKLKWTWDWLAHNTVLVLHNDIIIPVYFFFVNFACLITLSSFVETLARYDLMETSMPMNVTIDRNTRANGMKRATMGTILHSFFFYVLIVVIHV